MNTERSVTSGLVELQSVGVRARDEALDAKQTDNSATDRVS